MTIMIFDQINSFSNNTGEEFRLNGWQRFAASWLLSWHFERNTRENLDPIFNIPHFIYFFQIIHLEYFMKTTPEQNESITVVVKEVL